jgi:large subunit ribosomal protein L10
VANQRNQNTVAALRESLSGANSYFLVDYQGLTAGGLSSLRDEMRNNGARLIVAKNTLINLATSDAGHDFSAALKGPTAIVIPGEDPVGPVKAMVEFRKRNDKGIPTPKAGLLDGAAIGPDRFEDIAKLPSRLELYAELLGVLQAVPSNMVGVLGGKLQEFVGILDAKVAQADGTQADGAQAEG